MKQKKQPKKNRQSNSDGRRRIFKLLAVLLAAVLAGLMVETLYELNVARKERNGGFVPEWTEISQADVEMYEVDTWEGEPEKQGYRIYTTERYVHKFVYSYETDEDFTPDVILHTKNIYKEPELELRKDVCRTNLSESVMSLQEYVSEIDIQVPKGVRLTGFAIDNTFDFNWYRVGYVSGFVLTVLFILLFRRELVKRLEYGFLVICLSCGLVFVSIQPPECVSWDEHIHFLKAFDWFESGTLERSEAEEYLYKNPETVYRAPFLSKEEKAAQIEFLNEGAEKEGDTYERTVSLNTVGYVHMAFAIRAVKLLGGSFYTQYVVGKIANLLLYVLLMFWAIKILPAGKKFLTAVALMPTSLLQAVSYTYDIVLIGFLAVGFSMVIDEFYHLERKLTWKKLLLMAAVFVIGCCPKAMYIPLFAVTLAFPKEKFKSVRGMVIFKGLIILVCLAMMLTFIMPAAGGSVEGDARGGDTDLGRQMSLVFQHPLSYIRVFCGSFMQSLDTFIFGTDGLTNSAYGGQYPYPFMAAVTVFAVALTERKKGMKLSKKNTLIFKVMLALVIAAVIGLVWTSLYLVYTPVGNETILGVQSRYYVPLLLPLFFLFYSTKTEGRWEESKYNTVLFLVLIWLLHKSLYAQYFLEFCQ